MEDKSDETSSPELTAVLGKVTVNGHLNFATLEIIE